MLNVKNLIFSSDPMVIEKGEVVPFSAKNNRFINVDVVESKCNLPEFPYVESEHRKIYDEKYFFDSDVSIGTQVDFSVSRDKNGLISIVVSCQGHHEQTYSIDTYKSPIPPEVEQQIIQSIQLMDEE